MTDPGAAGRISEMIENVVADTKKELDTISVQNLIDISDLEPKEATKMADDLTKQLGSVF